MTQNFLYNEFLLYKGIASESVIHSIFSMKIFHFSAFHSQKSINFYPALYQIFFALYTVYFDFLKKLPQAFLLVSLQIRHNLHNALLYRIMRKNIQIFFLFSIHLCTFRIPSGPCQPPRYMVSCIREFFFRLRKGAGLIVRMSVFSSCPTLHLIGSRGREFRVLSTLGNRSTYET